MPILVTGGSGFVGLNLLEQLLARGETVVNFSLAAPPLAAHAAFATLPGALHHVDGDVRDAAAVETAMGERRICGVIHGAVVTAGRDRERRDAATIVSANVLGTVNVLEAARSHGVERFIYLSSASVYGANASIDEELSESSTIPRPESLYAITKYAAEGVSRRYRCFGEMEVVAARLSAVFGRWEHDTGLRDTLSPPFLLTGAAQRGDRAILPDENRRDWIYGTDVATAVIGLLRASSLQHDLYNVSAGTSWSAADWAERLRSAYPGFSYRVAAAGEAGDEALATEPRSPLNIDRLLAETGFEPRFGLERALSDYLEWRRAHQL